jgi:hypothetical protein
MRQTFCMPQPMSLYCSISHPMDPTNNVSWMRCLSNAHGSQMELFFRLAILRCWKEHQFFAKPSQNPWVRLTACPNQCPSTTAFPIHMDPTNNVWWMRCLSNAHGSQIMLIF